MKSNVSFFRTWLQIFTVGATLASAETTYWVATTHKTPTEVTYTYDVKVPDYFTQWVTESTHGGGIPVEKIIAGKTYTFVKQFFTWDTGGSSPARTGQIRIDHMPERRDGAWQHKPELKDEKSLIRALDSAAPAQEGNWRSADVSVLRWEGSGAPGLTFSEGNPEQPLSTITDGFGQFQGPPQAIGVFAGEKLSVAWRSVGGNTVKVAHYAGGVGTPCLWVKEYGLKERGTALATHLAGFTVDTTGENLFLMIARDEDMSRKPGWQFRDQVLRLIKINTQKAQTPTYASEWNVELNSDAYAQEADNGAPGDTNHNQKYAPIYSPLNAGTAGIAFGNDRIGIISSANSTPIDGSQRHQCAFRLSVNASDGSVAARSKWFSFRHSFNQRVIYDSDHFVFMDLADSDRIPGFLPGPGLNLSNISATADDHAKSTVVDWYCYTRCGHQNDTFTWMGDIRPAADGYTVLFASMRDSTIHTKDQQTPRDLGLVHVVKDFQDEPRNVESKHIVVDSNIVNTQAGNPIATSDETFTSSYDNIRKLQNTGIVWLTAYSDSTVVTPKLFKIPGQDRYLAVWEKWEVRGTPGSKRTADRSYSETCAMTFDSYGRNPSKEISLGKARLSDRSELFPIGSNAAWVVRTPEGVALYELDPLNPATPSATMLTAEPGAAVAARPIAERAPVPATPPGAENSIDKPVPPAKGEAAAKVETLVSIQSANFPERFVRHMSFKGRIDPIVSELDQKDATFRLVPGLADRTHVSLESATIPNHFLVVEGNVIMLRERKPNDATFDKTAGFIKRPGQSDPRLLSLESAAVPGAYVRHGGFVLYVAPSGDSAISKADATFKLTAPKWSATPTTPDSSEKDPLILVGHTKAVRDIAWSPDGSKLVSASYDNTARVWNASTGESLLTLTGHTDTLGSVDWSPDGLKIATASQDATARMWDAATGASLRILTGHAGRVEGVKWSPNSAKLAS
ncbi:MAG: AbfB domain-containing protein, partial [Kiritimatiellae bacterium]|nr:AbfB domain-containing protein [Kiritimatiellia bacterium]